jgi:hypothetical protein
LNLIDNQKYDVELYKSMVVDLNTCFWNNQYDVVFTGTFLLSDKHCIKKANEEKFHRPTNNNNNNSNIMHTHYSTGCYDFSSSQLKLMPLFTVLSIERLWILL